MLENRATRVLLTPQSFLWLIGVLLLLWALFLLRELILITLLAGLVAAAFYPAVGWLEKKRIPRSLAILLCYGMVALILIGMGFLLSDIIVGQGQALIRSLPSLVERALRFVDGLPMIREDWDLLATISSNIRTIVTQALDFIQKAFDYIRLMFHMIFGLISVLVFAFFLLSETAYFRNTALQLVPVSSRKRVDHLLKGIAHKAGAYARGQLMVMAATGLLTGIGLYLLGVPYALTLGVITFLFDIIPILGPLLAAGFGILVALAQDPLLALWTTLLYLAVQQIENNFLSPMILGRSVGLNSFWILFSIFAGGTLFGIVGVILAVPTAVAIGMLIEEFYIRGFVERPPNQRPPEVMAAD